MKVRPTSSAKAQNGQAAAR